MPDQSVDQTTDDADARKRLRERLADLERRGADAPPATRHDVRNALGAVRNALILLDEHHDAAEGVRFLAIAQRNIRLAEELLAGRGAEGVGSRGDERDDLGRARKRDDGNTLGL